MTWQDQTPQDRAARKTRRTRRRLRKQRLTVRLWSERAVEARTPADRTQLFFDLCRRQIKAIKGGGARDAAYIDLADVLREHAGTLPGADQILARRGQGTRSPIDHMKFFYDLCRRQIKAIKGGGARDAAYIDLAGVLRIHAGTLPGADQILALVNADGRE